MRCTATIRAARGNAGEPTPIGVILAAVWPKLLSRIEAGEKRGGRDRAGPGEIDAAAGGGEALE